MKGLFTSIIITITFSSIAQVRPKQHDWFFYDATYNYLLNTPGELEQSWRSNGHSISIMDDVKFGKSKFGIGYGLGYSSDNYFTNLGIATSFSSGEEMAYLLDMDTVKSNKFNVKHIFVPFEIRIRSDLNEKRNFWRFYVGGRFGVRISSYSDLETEKASVQYEHLGILSKFNYGVYTRIGYDHLSLYAYYGLSRIFEDGEVWDGTTMQKLEVLTPLSIGISFSL